MLNYQIQLCFSFLWSFETFIQLRLNVLQSSSVATPANAWQPCACKRGQLLGGHVNLFRNHDGLEQAHVFPHDLGLERARVAEADLVDAEGTKVTVKAAALGLVVKCF